MINVVDVSEDENDNDDMMMMIHQPEQKLFWINVIIRKTKMKMAMY